MFTSVLRALELDLQGNANRSLARSLHEVGLALKHDSVQAAIRLMDRAWRTLPDEVETLAPIYGRLLSLEDRDHDAALRLLERVAAPDADIAALTVHAYFRLRRADDAMRHMDRALRECCLAADGLLAKEASEALRNPDLGVAGWVGLGPTLEFHGELAASSVDSLQIRLNDTALAHAPNTRHRGVRT